MNEIKEIFYVIRVDMTKDSMNVHRSKTGVIDVISGIGILVMGKVNNFRITTLHRQLLTTDKRARGTVDLAQGSSDLTDENMTEVNRLDLSIQRLKKVSTSWKIISVTR